MYQEDEGLNQGQKGPLKSNQLWAIQIKSVMGHPGFKIKENSQHSTPRSCTAISWFGQLSIKVPDRS